MFRSLVVGAVAAYAAYRIFFGDDNQDDRPPSRPQSPEFPQPPVHRRDERQQRQTTKPPFFTDDNQVDRPPGHSQPCKSSQPPVHRHDERQQRQTTEPPFFADNNQVDRPPGHSQSRKFSQPPVHRHDERQQRQTIEPSQSDDTPLETGASLRARARQEGDLRTQCYQQSREASGRHDHVRAEALLEQCRRHELERDNLNAKASAAIFKENNQDKAPGRVDLHGLHVKEAIAYSEKAIAEARRRGDPEIRLIVGQGTHSDGGVPRLKPAIQDEMEMRGFDVEVDPMNPGVLIVQLDNTW